MQRLAVVAAAVAALVLVSAGGLIFLQLRTGWSGSSTVQSTGCRPQPCADAGGYLLRVRDVQIDGGLVRMRVLLTVRGRRNMHSVPDDFALIDARKHHVPPSFDAAGCDRWPRTQIPDGATIGPLPLCFRAGSATRPLLLNWSPDLGIGEYFSAGYDLRIQ